MPAGVGVVGVASQPDRDLPDQLDRDLPVVVPGCGVVVGVAKVGFRQSTGSCRFLAHHLAAGIQLTNFPRHKKRGCIRRSFDRLIQPSSHFSGSLSVVSRLVDGVQEIGRTRSSDGIRLLIQPLRAVGVVFLPACLLVTTVPGRPAAPHSSPR